MDIFNETSEEDIFGGITDEKSESTRLPTHLEMILEAASAILLFLATASSVVANILVIYAIGKFEKLKTDFNAIIVGLSASHLVYMLADPIFLLFQALFHDNDLPFYWYCTLFQIKQAGLSLHFVFAGLLAVDCYVRVYHPLLAERHQAKTKTLLKVIYALGFLYAFVAIFACFALERFVRPWLSLISFLTTAVVVVLVRIAVLVKSRRGDPPSSAAEFSLTISTVFLIFWTPAWTSHLLPYHHIAYGILVYAFHILAYCNPVFNVFLYAKLDVNFRAAFYKIYRCQVRGYENDFEDTANETNSNGVVVVSDGNAERGGGDGGGVANEGHRQ